MALTKICEKIIFWGTILILFTPLIISNKSFFPFVGTKSICFMGLVEIIFFTWLFLIILNSKYRPRFNILLISLLLFLLSLMVSTFLGVNLSQSFWSRYERMTGLLMWLHLIAFFLVISFTLKNKSEWLKIFKISIFVSILMSVISFFVKLKPDIKGILAFSYGGATTGNSSYMGVYLLFNILLALYLFFEVKNLRIKIFSLVAIFLGILAIYFADAKASFLSVLISFILLSLFWLIFEKKNIFKFLGISLLIVFIFGVFGLIYFSFQKENIIYQNIFQLAFKPRFVVWEIAWQGFLERPWFGWGPENFEIIFTKYFNPVLFLPGYGGVYWFDKAHNIVLDVLTTSGVIGLIFYLGIFFSAFFLIWRKYLKKEENFWMVGIFSITLIVYFIQNLTTFDMVNSYLMFFLVLGYIEKISFENKSNQFFIPPFKKINFAKKIFLIIILILFIFSFLNFVIYPAKADNYIVKAIRLSNPKERISFYQKNLKTSPLGKYQNRVIFAETTLEFAQSEALKKVSIKDFKSELDFISKELEKSIKESPLDYRSHLILGQVYNTYTLIDSSKINRGKEVLENAINLSPKNPQAYWFLAQNLLYQGDFKKAILVAEKSVEIEPRVEHSYRVLVELIKITGDYNLAKQKAKEAIEINPSLAPEFEDLLKN